MHTSDEGNNARQSAVIVGVVRPGITDAAEVEFDLDEIARLLDTLGVDVCERLLQRRTHLSASHLLGKGKVAELRAIASKHQAKLVVIDHPLSGVQIKNLETDTECEVIDRTAVILEIFAKHAKTKEAKTQVEIARLEYMLPRMVGQWTHFVRQSGGGVTVRGMGESQIEIDRRRARERINRLQKKLHGIRTERDTQRKLRNNELKVALVGYTNSGKTTLMQQMTQSPVAGENTLFATLDASVRVIDPRLRPNILLSDTVGFIRKLPSGLIESFKSTLEEVVYANLILHVVDISAPNYQMQMQTTENTLAEIGAADIPCIVVFNKVDRLGDPRIAKLLQKKFANSILVSALDHDDAMRVRTAVFSFFTDRFTEQNLKIPYDDAHAWSLLHRSCVIIKADYDNPSFALLHVKAAPYVASYLSRYRVDESDEGDISDGMHS